MRIIIVPHFFFSQTLHRVLQNHRALCLSCRFSKLDRTLLLQTLPKFYEMKSGFKFAKIKKSSESSGHVEIYPKVLSIKKYWVEAQLQFLDTFFCLIKPTHFSFMFLIFLTTFILIFPILMFFCAPKKRILFYGFLTRYVLNGHLPNQAISYWKLQRCAWSTIVCKYSIISEMRGNVCSK